MSKPHLAQKLLQLHVKIDFGCVYHGVIGGFEVRVELAEVGTSPVDCGLPRKRSDGRIDNVEQVHLVVGDSSVDRVVLERKVVLRQVQQRVS